MHIEPLDARRLFASGLDPTFADAGVLRFRGAFTPDVYNHGSVTGGGRGSTFVAGTVGDSPAVAKYDDRGRLITTFGDGGYAKVPYAPGLMTYDATNGLLYLATEAEQGDSGYTRHYSSQAYLVRLRPGGTVDSRFADHGVFNYRYALPRDDHAFVLSSIDRVNPLPDGSAVLAVERIDYDGSGAAQDLVLIKLLPDGRRDARYGDRGVAHVLGGSMDLEYAGETNMGYGSSRRGLFSDIQTNKRGVTSVVIEYAEGDWEYREDDPIDRLADYGRFSVKSRVVSARGVSDESQAHSWTLAKFTPDDGGFGFQYAGSDGQAVHAVASGIEPKAKDSVRQYLYTLVPGRRPVARRFEPKGVGEYVSSMTRSADGTYAAVNLGSIVTRLRADFTTDRSFGVRGLTHPVHEDGFAKDFFDPIIYTDNRGRVLAFEPAGSGDGLERFD